VNNILTLQWKRVDFSRRYLTVRENAGLDIRFHDLRHTAVTRMLEAGVPLVIVGWSPTQVAKIAEMYAHFSLDTLRQSMDPLAAERPLLVITASDRATRL
jgi:integrase